jgi:hypothetical protein
MIFDCLREQVQFCTNRLSGCPCVSRKSGVASRPVTRARAVRRLAIRPSPQARSSTSIPGSRSSRHQIVSAWASLTAPS